MNLQNVFATLALSSVLVACGGSDSSTSNTKNTGNTQETNNPTANPAAEAVVISGSVGQAAHIGSVGKLDTALLNNKTYYARYAYCLPNTDCSQVRNGVMHFETTVEGGNVSIKNLTVDAVGKSTSDTNKIPQFTAESSGTVSLASSSVTERDANNRLFSLKATPANSTENKVPNIAISVLITKDGKSMIGADSDYIFVAQQMASAPANWTAQATKEQVKGNWTATTVADNLKIKSKGMLSVKNTSSEVGGFTLTIGEKSFDGQYKNTGYGYAFGYNGRSGFLGVSGAIMLSPDGKFGVGYDGSENGGAFLLTK